MIKALARKEKAEIYSGGAAHMRSDHHAGRTWGKKGETPDPGELVWKHLKADTVGRRAIESYVDFTRR